MKRVLFLLRNSEEIVGSSVLLLSVIKELQELIRAHAAGSSLNVLSMLESALLISLGIDVFLLFGYENSQVRNGA